MDRCVGILGGGQLGRMLTEAANRLNIKVVTLDTECAPAKQINVNSGHVVGSFRDPEAIRRLARQCDVLTVEIEHVNTDVLEDLSEGAETREDWRLVRGTKIEVQPNWRTIRVIQDKYKQKKHLIQNGIATANSVPLKNGTPEELGEIARELGYPLMLKSRTDAYDGRGNFPVASAKDVLSALSALRDRPLYAEQWADFRLELAVMVVKVQDDAAKDDWKKVTLAYPVVETVHEDSICKLVYSPARNVPKDVMQKAQDLARSAVAGFWGKGVFGVEMFFLDTGMQLNISHLSANTYFTGELLINEIAPRPHNS